MIIVLLHSSYISLFYPNEMLMSKWSVSIVSKQTISKKHFDISKLKFFRNVIFLCKILQFSFLDLGEKKCQNIAVSPVKAIPDFDQPYKLD